MREKIFRVIIFSPYNHNVLDYVGRKDLVTNSGNPVRISRDGNDFIVRVEGHSPYINPDNIHTSFYLNMMEVGVME